MKTVNSVSGGKTSAYIAAHYPADYNVFALVCIDDPKCAPKDKKALQYANDRLDRGGYIEKYGEFIATTEDDIILYTMMDLEQHIGQEVTWVRGISFDEVVEIKGGGLPNKLHRYCTVHMKIEPIFDW